LPLHLQDLVQKSGLIGDAPRLGFDDAAMTQYSRSFFTQAPPRGGEIAITPPEV